MKEKKRIIVKMIFVLITPIFFSFFYYIFPKSFKKKIDDIYVPVLEKEIFLTGNSFKNHGIIKIDEKDQWKDLLKKIKGIKKSYRLVEVDQNESLPKDFFFREKLDLDDYLKKIKVKNGKFKSKKYSRRLRYR